MTTTATPEDLDLSPEDLAPPSAGPAHEPELALETLAPPPGEQTAEVAPVEAAPAVMTAAHEHLNRFVLGSAAAACVVFALRRALSDPRTEAVDKVYFLSALAAGGVVLALRRSWLNDIAAIALGLVGCVIMFWGFATIEHLGMEHMLWMGFGKPLAVAALLLIPLVGFLIRPGFLDSPGRRTGGIAFLIVVAAVGALSFYQTRDSLPEANHSSYIFNEIYAVAAGHLPYVDYIPQYQTLFSYLFYPIIMVLGADQAIEWVLFVLSGLSMGIVALGVVAGWRASSGLNRLIAPLLILPLVFLTQGSGRVNWSGSISALHSAYPVRMLVPVLVGALIGQLPLLGVERWKPNRHALALGALLGLGCYHQLDFGLAAGFATVVTILVAVPLAHAVTALGRLALGAVAGFAVVPLLHLVCRAPIDPAKFGWFVRQFGGGFGSEPIQLPGPVLVVLPLLVGGVVTCLGVLIRARRTQSLDEPNADESATQQASAVQRAAVLGCYFGTFAIAGFPYYLNRSYASGQMQILFLPLGILLVALTQIIAGAPGAQEQVRSVRSVAFRFALAAPIACLLLLPSPLHEVQRLLGKGGSLTRWPGETTSRVVATAHQGGGAQMDKAVGYFGIDGNYIEAATGLRNVTRFSSPQDAAMSPAAVKELCDGLIASNVNALIFGDYAIDPDTCQPGWRTAKHETGLLLGWREK